MALVVGLSGCQSPARAPGVLPLTAVATPAAQFVGDAVCGECHKAEFALHHGSRHDTTLRLASVASLGAATPPLGAIPGTPYSIEAHGGAPRFQRADRPDIGAPIAYAFGSGYTAVTYVGIPAPDALVEYRMTYLPRLHRWTVTPGQRGNADLGLGLLHELGGAKKCVLCHAVKAADNAVTPAPGFLGVGCEACHGAGGHHAAAARKPGASGVKMDDMSAWGADRIDAVCARCHRSAADIAITSMDASSTARFQPYALEMSPCFKGSKNRLSCITCHDAHADASRDPRWYEKACLSCHSPGAAVPAKSCPVNPQTKCVGCHMPSRRIFAGTNVPISMSDHLIWAYRKPKM